mgnify:CR=1 FL=1
MSQVQLMYVVCSNVVCSNVVAQMLQHNVVKSQNVIISVRHIASITQAAAVIRYAYSVKSLAGTSLLMTPYTEVVIYAEIQYWKYTYINDVQTNSQNVGVASISIDNIQGDTIAFDIATYTSNQVQIALMETYDGAMCRWTVNVKPSNSSMPNRTLDMSVHYMN